MENYLGNKVSQEELLRHHHRQRSRRQAHNAVMTSAHQQQQQQHHQMRRQPYSPITPTGPDTPMAASDAALEDMIRSNNQEIEQIQRNNAEIQRRRRSLPQHYHGGMTQAEADRRSSMLEFANGDNAYNFSSMTNSPIEHMGQGMPNMSMNTAMTMPGTSANFSPQNLVADDFSMNSPDVIGNMGAFSNMNLATDPSMNFNSSMAGNFTSTPMDAMSGFGMDMGADDTGLATPQLGQGMDSSDTEMMNTSPQFVPTTQAQQQPGNFNLNTPMSGYNRISPAGPSRTSSSASIPSQPNQNTPGNSMGSSASYLSPHPVTSNENSREPSSSSTQQSPANPAMGPPPPKEQKTIYSKSGFDMLRALWQVATRKNPQVNLGAVDMSCAFVVCDVTMNDCPIIYVSDNFQNLTGYSQHDIIGQNCRFLQAPDGAVEAGTRREFVDNGAVYNLKQKIAEGKEVQQSLINYRKGGKPFLNLLTMIPIPWDTPEIRYIIGFQIDLVECPDAIAQSQGPGTMKVNYKHSDIGQYIWNPPNSNQLEENGQTLGVDDVSTLLQQFNPNGAVSDWHRQSWDKMILENADDVVHVLSLKGLFLYLSPSAKRILEYDSNELVGSSLSSICHPSDIVPVTRELKETTSGNSVNIVFRIRRKQSGYTWFESHGSLFIEQGKGRKCIILIGRKRPVFALSRSQLEANGGIGDSEMWTKLSTSGMFLFVSANVRSLLDLQPENLIGTSIQDLMRKESRPEFGRSIEKARRGRTVTCKHEVQNRRGQVLQAHTILYPGDASEGQKPTFLLAQTKLLKASSRAAAGVPSSLAKQSSAGSSSFESKSTNMMQNSGMASESNPGVMSAAGGGGGPPGNQDTALASEDNIFDELKTTRCTSWQYELRQMEKINRVLAEELHGLLSNKKKRKRRKGVGNVVRDCANCHTRNTPEWRRGPSGQRDLCNSCGLRWAKQTGRVSPRNSSRGGGGDGSKKSNSPVHSSPLHREVSTGETSEQPSESDTNTTANRSSSGSAIAGPGTASAGTTPGAMNKGFTMPPLSQPLLEGGAAGSEMTAIQEEGNGPSVT